MNGEINDVSERARQAADVISEQNAGYVPDEIDPLASARGKPNSTEVDLGW